MLQMIQIDIPIAPPPVPRHKGHARTKEDEFDAVDHNVEELSPMTQTQNQTGYASHNQPLVKDIMI